MAEPDWEKRGREDAFEFRLLDVWGMEQVDVLENVTDARITEGYYSDSRMSGTLSYVGEALGNVLVRIVHKVPLEGYSHVLGTFFIVGDSPSVEKGVESHTLDLESTLARFSDDVLEKPYSAAKGASVMNLVRRFVEGRGGKLRIAAGTPAAALGSARVWDVGENALSYLYDLADAANIRLSVSEDGYVTLAKYVAPSRKDERGDLPGCLVVDGASKTTEFYSATNRWVVSDSDGDKKTVSGHADLSGQMGRGLRGRYVATHTSADLSPMTAAAATRYAKGLVSGDEGVEYSMTTLYRPIRCGDVWGIPYDGDTVKCFLKSRELTIGPGMPCSDVWKEC